MHPFGLADASDVFAALTHTFGADPSDAIAHMVGLGDSISGVNIARLNPGQSIALGQTITSPNGRMQLTMQSDGNLVAYSSHGHTPLWASNTNGKGGVIAVMQSDGNLVVYNQQKQPLWASNTDKHPGSFLAIQDDGNIVVYEGTHALWASNTSGFQKAKSGGGGFDVGNIVASAVHDVGKATGLPADQVLNVAKNAGDAVAKAVTSGAKLVEQAGGDAGKFVEDRANAIAKDPLGTLTQVATTGPIALVGNPDQILKSLGIPTPDDLLKKVGIPPFSFPSPDALAHITNPQELLEHLPGLSQFSKFLPTAPNPQDYTKKIMSAVSSGNLDQIKSAVMSVGHQVADSMSMVPGIGDVISAPLAAAITALESGSPLQTTLELLLSQAPIPPDIKGLVLRPAIKGISDVVEKHESVSDALIDAFKSGIMAELQKQNVPDPARKLIGDLIDAMVQIILKHKPLDQAAAGLAKQGIDTAIGEAQKQFGSIPGMPSISSLLPGAGKVLQLPAGLPNVPGLDTALSKISSLQKGYEALKSVGDKTNKIFALTQGIIKLNQQDPNKTNPAIQKQVQDMKTSIEAQKVHLASHAQQLNANLGKQTPHHRRHKLKVAGSAVVSPPPVAAAPAPAVAAPVAPPPVVVAPVAPAPVPTPVTTPAPVTAPAPAPAKHHHKKKYPPYPAATAKPAIGTSNGDLGRFHGGGGRFGGGRGYGGRGGWPYVVAPSSGCVMWGSPIALSGDLLTFAQQVLAANGNQPVVRSYNGVTYMFSLQNGFVSARQCAGSQVGISEELHAWRGTPDHQPVYSTCSAFGDLIDVRDPNNHDLVTAANNALSSEDRKNTTFRYSDGRLYVAYVNAANTIDIRACVME